MIYTIWLQRYRDLKILIYGKDSTTLFTNEEIGTFKFEALTFNAELKIQNEKYFFEAINC